MSGHHVLQLGQRGRVGGGNGHHQGVGLGGQRAQAVREADGAVRLRQRDRQAMLEMLAELG